jgi:predicted ATP-grasp superfamily ATP-dependent carboligase
MITVLVYEFASGGGFDDAAAPPSILAEGRAMRDALCLDLAEVPGITVIAASGDAVDQPAAGQALFPARGEAPAEFLRRSAAAADAVWLIAPESDGIAFALTQVLEQSGRICLGCRSDAVALASSKSRTLAHLAAAGLATTPTWPLAQAPLHLHERWVLKPDVGCGCEAMHRLSRAAAEAVRRGSADGGIKGIIAQPWLADEAMSLSLLAAKGEAELLSVNRQHIAVATDGALSLVGIDRNIAVALALRAALKTFADRIVRSMPGLAGFVGIDFMLAKDGKAIVLEVNPRLTSAYVGLSGTLGRNLAAEVLHSAMPEFAHA